VAGSIRDELWQPSLDDVLGDLPTKSGQTSDMAASGHSNTPGTSTPASTESSPRKWREWDAEKADEALREIQATSIDLHVNIKAQLPLLKDTHRQVAVENGTRVRLIKGATSNGRQSENSNVTHHPKFHQTNGIKRATGDGLKGESSTVMRLPQPHHGNSIKSATASRNDKELAAGKALQSGINFRLLTSKVMNAGAHSEQPERKSLDIVLPGLSITENPMHPRTQVVFIPPTTFPDFKIGNGLGSFASQDEDLISFE
jgi:hypothetical protein